MTQCKICKSNSNQIFRARILGKYDISYFECTHCGFVQTEEPFWLEEAYESAINITDTGIIKRNFFLVDVTAMIHFFNFKKNEKILDFAGGHGIITRMLRDIGIDAYWQDKYAENIYARGFEYVPQENYNLLTAFEVFEHLTDPMREIENLLDISDNILFSTRLLPKKVPQPSKWWYYGLEHGQHVALYSNKTLKYIADKYHLNVYSDGKAIHFLTKKKINPLFFKYITKFTKAGLLQFIKWFYHSKTDYDHSLLSKS